MPFIATGDIVREIAANEKVEMTRENLGRISQKYFKLYGRGCFIRMAVDLIRKANWKTAGVSGIRSPDDVAILKELLGDGFILVAVTVTDPGTRYRRMMKRGEGRDRGELEQFRLRDAEEEKLFHVSEAIKQADISIANDGGVAELYTAIDSLITNKRLPVELNTKFE
jgi:dephospho-CoA kinase